MYGHVIYTMILNCLFGAVKLTKNTDPDKYPYSRYGINSGRITFFNPR